MDGILKRGMAGWVSRNFELLGLVAPLSVGIVRGDFGDGASTV